MVSFPVDEIPKIKQKFLNADYLCGFSNGVINNSQEKSEETDDYIIPPGFFVVPKKVVLVDIQYCPKNEEFLKHEDTQKDSEPAKHLKNNLTYSFTWKVLLPASTSRHIRQNMEASIITLKQPSLNEQVESKKLLLLLLEFVPLPIADQLQPNFYKLPCVEQRITKLD